MKFDENTKIEDIVKAYDDLVKDFIKGNQTIENAKTIKEAALKSSEDYVGQLCKKLAVLHPEIQGEIAIILQKIIGSTYLTCAAEVIEREIMYNRNKHK
jgi:hypothetical protein